MIEKFYAIKFPDACDGLIYFKVLEATTGLSWRWRAEWTSDPKEACRFVSLGHARSFAVKHWGAEFVDTAFELVALDA